jgi:uroporphyrinogen-III decarboxylase
MDKSEVIKTIEHKRPQRVPCWFNYFAGETKEKYGRELAAILKDYPDDFIIASFESPGDWEPEKEGMDEWGVVHRHIKGGVGSQAIYHPLDNWDKLNEYFKHKFPDPNAPGRFDNVQKARKENPDKYIMGHWWLGIFERMHLLRGMEDLFSDLYFHQKEVNSLGEKLLEFSLGIVDNFQKIGVDGVFFADDWGTQERLMINPELWRKIFKPWYRKLIDRIHKGGMHAIFHSCGNITEILPDLIEIGLDVIHPVQPGAMDGRKVVKEFGAEICFFGGIDVQHLLPEGTPEDVRNGIKEMIENFNNPEGGFIAAPANTIMPETPLENIKVMCESLREYGRVV